MTCFERVQAALSRLRDHFRDLVSSSRVKELEGLLQAEKREKERITQSVEDFVADALAPPDVTPDPEDGGNDVASDGDGSDGNDGVDAEPTESELLAPDEGLDTDAEDPLEDHDQSAPATLVVGTVPVEGEGS